MEYVLVLKPEVCTGCRLCESVCSFHHEKVANPILSRIKVIKDELRGLDVPFVCLQCEDAPCISICPVGALSKNKDTGATILDDSLCIGCKACTIVCPFGAISINPTGKLFLCDLCDGDPQCVKFCTTKAVDYIRSDKLADVETKRYSKEIKKKLEEVYSRTGGIPHALGPQEY